MAGIYVHVPFCHAKCAYCDFYSIADSRRSAEYANAVIAEYQLRRHELGGEPVRTLYYGGGTPSNLSNELLSSISKNLLSPDVEEFTIEVNPEDVSPRQAAGWRAMGAGRVSMGVQSLVDSELSAIRRRHSAGAALSALVVLRNAGFSNISADLIYGLPGQTPETFDYSLQTLLDAGIEHLSAYILSYESGTLLSRRLAEGIVAEASDETIEAMYSILCRRTAEAGFEHYEISNFARPGMRSRHNSAYWNLTPYLGLGPGAHSLGADGIRRRHIPSLRRYLEAPAVVEVEPEDETDRLNDIIMVSLRRAEGLSLNDFSEVQRRRLMASAAPYIDSGTLCRAGSRLFIPESRWLVSDAVIRELFF